MLSCPSYINIQYDNWTKLYVQQVVLPVPKMKSTIYANRQVSDEKIKKQDSNIYKCVSIVKNVMEYNQN